MESKAEGLSFPEKYKLRTSAAFQSKFRNMLSECAERCGPKE
jgi:hypothetical protein